MPSRRPTSSTRSAKPATTRAVRTGLPASRIRWDRKARLIMLGVLVLVGWVGMHAFLSVLRTRAQAEQELSLVSTLARENHVLMQQAQALEQPATIVREARALGMVKDGERAYVITGLSGG